MPFEFRPGLRRRSRKPVPATINDIHIPPGTDDAPWARSMIPKTLELKGYAGFSLGNKNPKLRSRYVRHPGNGSDFLMVPRRAHFAFELGNAISRN